jgi:hypothetical protein
VVAALVVPGRQIVFSAAACLSPRSLSRIAAACEADACSCNPINYQKLKYFSALATLVTGR